MSQAQQDIQRKKQVLIYAPDYLAIPEHSLNTISLHPRW
jgi:hypothetical protein